MSILMEHNIQTYEEAVKALDEFGRVAIVQPTGTGKSYIEMQILQDYKNVKKIVIAPSKKFLKGLENNQYWEKENTITFTYQFLTKNMDRLYSIVVDTVGNPKEVGLIVIDEMHRAGAVKWSKAINKLMSICSKAKVLGLTATPYREKDKIDMVDELFGGHSVGNISLYDAISKGILSKFNYIVGVASADADIRSILKNYDKHKFITLQLKDRIIELSNKWKSGISYYEVLKKYLSAEKKPSKHIVFFTSIKELESNASKVEQWFRSIYEGYDIQIEIMHHGITGDKIEKSISNFAAQLGKNQIKIALTVQMINESFHFDNIQSIVMFRHTKSTGMFIQQIGRGMSTLSKGVYIFDFVDNIYTVGSMAFMIGNNNVKDINLDALFNYFKDETNGCKLELLKLQQDIDKKIAFWKNMIPVYLKRYETLYDIPDDEMRAWMLMEFRSMHADSNSVLYKYKDRAELTEFIMFNTSQNWLYQYRNYSRLSAEEKQRFIEDTVKLNICNLIPDRLMRSFEDKFGIVFESYRKIDKLIPYFENDAQRMCIKVMKLYNSVNSGNEFYALYYGKQCYEFFSKYGTTSMYRQQNIAMAAANLACMKILDSNAYKELVSTVTDAEMALVRLIIIGFNHSNYYVREYETFTVVNNLLKNRHRCQYILDKLTEHHKIGSIDRLIESLDRIEGLSSSLNEIENWVYDSAASYIGHKYVPVPNYVINKAEQIIQKYGAIELHGCMKERMDDFIAQSLPIIVSQGDSEFLNNFMAEHGIVSDYTKQVKLLVDKKMSLEKSMKEINRLKISIGAVCRNNGIVYSTFPQAVEEYVKLISTRLNIILRDNYNGKIAIEKSEKIVDNIYLMHSLALAGFLEFSPVFSITKNWKLLEVLDRQLMSKTLASRINHMICLVSKGMHNEEAVIKAGLGELKFVDFHSLYTIDSANIKRPDSMFYRVIHYLYIRTYGDLEGRENFKVGLRGNVI